MTIERDYVLGTHDEEMVRLGLQHRVWRPMALECWQKAGVTSGSRVLDVGAGPGYATIDLAEIVGPAGAVVAYERSGRFLQALEERCRACDLRNVRSYELDLIKDEWPEGSFDFSWCRWVASFVSDPSLLVRKLSLALRPGGRAIFHEYGHYLSWRFIPRLPRQEEFARKVKGSWQETGGKADIALDLPTYLTQNGFVLRSITPRLYCVRPAEYMWQWPATYVEIGLARLQELGKIDASFAAEVREEVRAAGANPQAFMVTPLVLEIVAEKLS